jgi:hypothetical protein
VLVAIETPRLELGALIEIVVNVEHPATSDASMVWVPELKEVLIVPVEMPSHVTVYVLLPFILTVAAPVAVPKHLTLLLATIEIVGVVFTVSVVIIVFPLHPDDVPIILYVVLDAGFTVKLVPDKLPGINV